jgi:hypothetical protein
MTTVASVIQSALRESNTIPLGITATAAQTAEALVLLSTIVSGVLGNEAGENLLPFPLGQGNIESPSGYPWWNNSPPSDMFLPTNIRLMCNLTDDGTVNLHPRPNDGARMGVVDVGDNFATNTLTINGNGRNIEGATTQTYSTDGLVREWVYRGDLGNWVTVIPLTEDGDMPWPEAFDDFFIITLAMRLNPRYCQTLAPESISILRQARVRFAARYSQSPREMPVEEALQYMTNSWRMYGGDYRYGDGDPDSAFNSGYPL